MTDGRRSDGTKNVHYAYKILANSLRFGGENRCTGPENGGFSLCTAGAS